MPRHTEPELETVEGESSDSGWETPPASETVVTPCKRHTYKDSDTCLKCGFPRPARPTRPTRTPRAPRAVTASSDSLETLIAMLWGAIGLGIEHQPLIGKEPRKYVINDVEVEGASTAQAVGKALQMEAAVAGRRIDHAWRKGSPLSYMIVNAVINKVSWATDLAPLLVAPMIVALPPAVLERVKPQLAQALIPVLVEQAHMMRKQAEMMDNLDQFTKEAVTNAEAMIDEMLGLRKQESAGAHAAA